jgi:hypothetical protein
MISPLLSWIPNNPELSHDSLKTTVHNWNTEIEKTTTAAQNALVGLTAFSGCCIFMSPALGMTSLISCGSALLINRDIKRLCTHIRENFDPILESLHKFHRNLFSKRGSIISSGDINKLTIEINCLLDQASSPLSPLGKTCLEFSKEATLAVLKIKAGILDKDFIRSMLELYSGNETTIPNLDYIREGIINATQALNNLSYITTYLFGCVAICGSVSFVLGSTTPALFIYLGILYSARQKYHINQQAFAALAFVGAVFLYMTANLASLTLVLTSSVGLALSYDLKQLANNIGTVANDILKDKTPTNSGKIAKILSALSYVIPFFPRPEKKNQEQLLQELNAVKIPLQQNLSKGMTPLGSSLIPFAFSYVKTGSAAPMQD